MLSKIYSITKKEFKFVSRKAKRIFLDIFNIKYTPNNKNHAQFSIVISKKIAKLATRRNKMRRQIKAWISENKQLLNKNYYFIIFLKKPIDDKIDISKVKDILIKTLNNI